MRILIVVPAKSTSERVEGKNVLPFNGVPLYMNALDIAMRACQLIHTTLDDAGRVGVYLDSDSEEMIEMALHRMPEFLVSTKPRPVELATNATDGSEILVDAVQRVRWFLQNTEDEVHNAVVVQLLCTAPFIKPETIVEMVKAVISTGRAQVLSTESVLYEWKDGKPAYLVNGRIPNSAGRLPIVHETMGAYAVELEDLLSSKSRTGANGVPFVTNDPMELLDVNTNADYRMATELLRGQAAKEAAEFKALALEVGSAQVMDLCIRHGIVHLLRQAYQPASAFGLMVNSNCIIGRVATMELAALKEDEDEDAIYEALNHYDYVLPGTVLLVSNPTQYAYFGGLNARLAVRAGAVGYVTDGATRDVKELRRSGLGVWSQLGATAHDVLGQAKVKSIAQPIRIFNREVNPGDVLVADEDGMVIVPASSWSRLYALLRDKATSEASVALGVAFGRTVKELRNSHGDF